MGTTDERIPFELPMRIEQEPAKVKFVKKYVSLCVSIAKKFAIAAMQGNNKATLDDEMETVLLKIWDRGYSKGLRDMDKMHSQASKRQKVKKYIRDSVVEKEEPKIISERPKAVFSNKKFL